MKVCEIDKIKGRGTIATKTYEIGDTILTEFPLLHTPKFGNCFSCLKPLQKVMRCSKCGFNEYCSRECQVQDFKKYHRLECGKFSRFVKEREGFKLKDYLTPTILLVMRIVLFRRYCGEKFKKFCELDSSCIGKIDGNTKLTYQQISLSVIKFLGMEIELKSEKKKDNKNKNRISIQEITELLCRIKTNTFNILVDTIHENGIGIYYNSAFFNHDCEANCIQTFVGKKLVMKAMKKIEENGELTIKYCDPVQSTLSRRKDLMENYFFTCKCDFCEDKNNRIEKIANVVNPNDFKEEQYEKSLEMYKTYKMNKGMNLGNDLKVLEEIHKIHRKNLGMYNEHRYHPLSSYYRCCIGIKDFDHALMICEDLLRLMEKYYLETDPMMLYQRVMYLKLAWYKGLEKYSFVETKKLQPLVYKLFDKNDSTLITLNSIVHQMFYMKEKNN